MKLLKLLIVTAGFAASLDAARAAVIPGPALVDPDSSSGALRLLWTILHLAISE
jgi:hypothetical protein